ncbi:MarR family winged helix-turn-helix transcriptional regulator [Sphingobium yanoikuyae]|uniref:MarR family winged helix-turn-helix transcriptional regulator n=1 Tax=Sphingobium yanoikuyae TaxID=13690 RepID=UPI001F4685C0|nr:MarR family transcriptional regulator [Sphingobium yanoikuyae]
MTIVKHGRLEEGRSERGVEACRALLEAHFAEHRTIPSMAGLARLWGYASKSSASRRVDQLIAAGVLVWSPDRRLAPGAAVAVSGKDAGPEPIAQKEDAAADPLQAALAAWASDYDPALVRCYSITARLLRAAHCMERQMTRSAASEGLTSGDVLLMDALYRVGPPHRIAPTALKDYFLMSLAGVAKRVDRLEARGFIRRVPNPDDRRGLFTELTAEGQAALARLVEADRAAPHIVWPTALSDAQYRTMLESLAIAEEMVITADSGAKNERS